MIDFLLLRYELVWKCAAATSKSSNYEKFGEQDIILSIQWVLLFTAVGHLICSLTCEVAPQYIQGSMLKSDPYRITSQCPMHTVSSFHNRNLRLPFFSYSCGTNHATLGMKSDGVHSSVVAQTM